MANELERLIVSLDADIEPYRRKLQQAQAQTNTRLRNVESRYASTTARIGKQSEVAGSKITRAFRGAATSATLLHGPLSGIGSRVTAISGSISRGNVAMAGFALTIGAVTYSAYKALAAFQEFETQGIVIENLLRSTGGSSGKTAKDIEDLAQSIASATLASTQGVRKAAGVLLTFRTVAGDAFDRALRAAQDLAATGIGSIETNALQLGKALEDPIQGLSALKRSGVSFSESQKLVITRMLQTGRVAEAQSKILDGVESQVGGAGNARGLAGAYDTLSQSVDNLLVKWGKQIAEGIRLESTIKGIASAVDAVNKAAGGGSLEDRLVAVNERIERLRARARPPGIQGLTYDRNHEKEINDANRERMVLERLLEVERLKQAIAKSESDAAQKAIADEQA